MPSAIEGTYKAREVEGLLDLYFYRRVGFVLAHFFARLKMTPSSVSALAGFFGIVAGHLYFYRDLRLNAIGMLLHVLANALDNADGQLARLTNSGSRFGRLADSFADHCVFISIYCHLVLRCLYGGAPQTIWILALAAGYSHSLQAAVADYCRNAYLFFSKNRARAEFDSSATIRADYETLSWQTQPWEKILLRFYLNFTRTQEILLPNLKKLRSRFISDPPANLSARYREIAEPNLWLLGFLMTNIRMFFLFAVLFANRPSWFFWIEVSFFNLVMFFVINRQEKTSHALIDFAAEEHQSPKTPITVTQVRSKKERDAFIRFPWRIYRDDPAWVPPLIIERREFLDQKKHPFFEHGDAALFLARRNGEIVGRIMASEDPNYNRLHGASVGCFGLFECIDDVVVARALFDAATDWIRGKGHTEILGPIDYSTNYVCGLLIDGFQFPPMLLTSHNPRYYARLIEDCGFEKAKDLYAWWFSEPDEAARRLRRVAGRFEKRATVTIRHARVNDIRGEAKLLREIYNQAWEKNWGFVPFTEREIDFMTKELKPLIIPELGLLAQVDGRPVGFILCVPDINDAFKKIDGRLFHFGLPIGLVKLLYYKSRLKTVRLIALGVVPEFRRHGIAERLVLSIIEEGMLKRGLIGECSLTLEDNRMINRFMETIGAEKYKTYRIYRRAITR